MTGRIGWQGMALLALIGLQAWSLQRMARLQATIDALRSAPGIADAAPPRTAFDAAMAASLARIESRLAAADIAAGPARATDAPPASASATAAAMPLAAADARLAALLPAGGALRDAELDALRARILALPAAERLPVSLALSRAINRGAVRVTP